MDNLYIDWGTCRDRKGVLVLRYRLFWVKLFRSEFGVLPVWRRQFDATVVLSRRMSAIEAVLRLKLRIGVAQALF
jgi:hypothetical protein